MESVVVQCDTGISKTNATPGTQRFEVAAIDQGYEPPTIQADLLGLLFQD